MNSAFLENQLVKKGHRQCELARACGYLSATRLNAILRGWQMPGPKTMRRLAEGLRALGYSDGEIAACGIPLPDESVGSSR